MRKFNSIEKSCGWKAIYLQIASLFGQEETDLIFDKATALSEEYKKNYTDCKGIKKLHVQSAITFGSLYLSIKDKVGSEKAVKMLEEGAKPGAIRKHNKIERFPAWLYLKMCPSSLRKCLERRRVSSADGFAIRQKSKDTIFSLARM